MQMKRWKITYQYPKHYEREFTTHFTDRKSKPDEIEEKHRFIGVIGVKIEEIPVNPRVWVLKEILQHQIDAYNKYVELEGEDGEEAENMIRLIRYFELLIFALEGNIFTIKKINHYLYIESTNLHDIKKP